MTILEQFLNFSEKYTTNSFFVDLVNTNSSTFAEKGAPTPKASLPLRGKYNYITSIIKMLTEKVFRGSVNILNFVRSETASF